MQAFFGFLGRLSLSSIFIFSGIFHVLEWNSWEQTAFTTLSSAVAAGHVNQYLHPAVEFALSHMSIVFAGGVFLQLLGGICILFKWNVKLGAFLLLLFLIPSTIILHDFWNKNASLRIQETLQFGKNVAIAGGLFLLLAEGRASVGKKSQPVEKEK